MSNTRQAKGAAPSRPPVTKLPPPSADVAERSLAEVIGQAVALHLGELLAPLLARLPQEPGCLMCAARAKRAERAHEIALANAKAAAEPAPEQPDLTVGRSFTEGARGPVCWDCYDPGEDGPLDMAGYLPPAAD